MLRKRLIALSALLLVSTVALAQAAAPESSAASEKIATSADSGAPAEPATPENSVIPADSATPAETAAPGFADTSTPSLEPETKPEAAAAPSAEVAEPTTATPTPQAEPAVPAGMHIYEVKKGDTLWGISRKFIEDPYYWPDLWANNPEITNPHLITPGQKLRIYSGPIMVVTGQPAETEPAETEPTAVTEPTTATEPNAAVIEKASTPSPQPEAVAVAESSVIVMAPAGTGYISKEELSGVGEIYDFADDRGLAVFGDTVFIRMKPKTSVQVGDRFEIYKTLEKIRNPLTGKSVGYQVADLGSLEVTALHADVCTAVIRNNFREIERGAWLAPYRPTRSSITLKKAKTILRGHLLSNSDQRILRGQGDIVFVDLGKNQGLEIGNMLTVTRPRKGTEVVKTSSKTRGKVALPDELIGYALVVEVKTNAATAVMIKALEPVLIGDQAQTQIGK